MRCTVYAAEVCHSVRSEYTHAEDRRTFRRARFGLSAGRADERMRYDCSRLWCNTVEPTQS